MTPVRKFFGVFIVVLSLVSQLSADVSVVNRSPGLAVQPIEADIYSGSSIQQIPIATPAGINGIQPNLSLVYSSDRVSDRLGIGWSLPTSSIKRSTKIGVPQYSSNDSFDLFLDGSRHELVFDTGSQLYRPKVEGLFFKIEKLSDSWIVTDKQGTKYFFGATSDAKLYDPAQTSNVFQWFLNRVEDVHGNYMAYAYTRVGAQVYLQTIDYTGNIHKPLQPFVRVELTWEDRFKNHRSFESAFEIITTKRLAKVTSKIMGTKQWEYQLTYTASRSTQRDLLTRIAHTGSDGNAYVPPTDFTYYDNDKGFTLDSNAAIPDGARFSNQVGGLQTYQDLGVRIFDVNGDAYPDLIRDYVAVNGASVTHIKAAYMNNKNKTWTLNSQYNLPGDCVAGLDTCATFIREVNTQQNGKLYVDYGLMAVDKAGDGRMDLINKITYLNVTNNGLDYSTQQANYGAFFDNQGNGWIAGSGGLPQDAATMMWAQVINDNNDYYKLELLGNIFADVNKDGFMDVVMSNKANLPTHLSHPDFTNSVVSQKQVYLNGGGVIYGSWTRPDNDYTDFSKGAVLVDLNADGLPDIFYRKAGTTKVFMNTGKLWQEDATSPWLSFPSVGDFKDGSTQLADINGDGLTDLVVAKAGVGNGSSVLINTGDGWSQDNAWVLPEADFRNLGTRLLDADADTLEDIMVHYNGSAPKLYVNSARPADLLASVDNNYGGERTFNYGSSSEFPQTFLPFALPIMHSIDYSNSLGAQYTTQYEYKNGLWVPPFGSTPGIANPVSDAAREFMGFGEVKVIDDDLNYTIKEFQQDKIALRGMPKRERRYSANNALMMEKTYNWGVENLVQLSMFSYIQFPRLQKEISCVLNAAQNKKCSAQNYAYNDTPQLGNLTQLTEMGEVDASGNDVGTDSRQTIFTYVNNTANGNWLVGLPSSIVLRGHDGEAVSKRYFHYDDQAYGATPIKGLLTRLEEDAGGGSNPATVVTYDVLGQVKTLTEPNNVADASDKKTVTTYDSTVGIFPITVTNEKDQSVSFTYYGINATPEAGYQGLWGQLKSTTDENNATTSRSYDAMGWSKAVVSPLDSIQFPTTSYDYSFGSDHSVTTIKQRLEHGTNKTLDVTTYSDGLGRLLFSRRPARLPGQFTIEGLAEYDQQGRAVKQFLPRFSFSTGLVSAQLNDPAKTNSYDALGRVTQTINPDGTRANWEHDLWNVRAFDENGHRQDAEFDAFGQLIKKTEFTGADGRFAAYPITSGYTEYATTTYKYDAAGNLKETTDPNSEKTTINYNLLGQKTSMQDPDMGIWTYNSYDANGNLKQSTDARGQTLFFSYDKLNRPMVKQDAGNLNVSYIYDDPVSLAIGRLFKIDEGGQNSTQFSYDTRGRAETIQKTINGQIYNTGYDYDAADRVLKIAYPNQLNLFYKYDAAGQVAAAAAVAENLPTDASLTNPKPNTPALLSATAGDQKVTLQWSAAQDATNYEVKYGTQAGALTQSTGLLGNVLNKEITGLTNNQSYYFAVLARNANGTSLLSNAMLATPISGLTAPTLAVSSVGDRSVNLSWTAVSGATQYFVKYGNSETDLNQTVTVSNATQATVSNLNNMILYFFSVTASNGTIQGPESNVVHAIPEPPYPQSAPIFVDISSTASSITLSWAAHPKATEYKVEYGQNLVGPYPIEQIVTQPTFTATGLTEQTNYYFRIYARNSFGSSPASQPFTGTTLANPPAAPMGLAATAGSGSVTLNWNAVSGATSYRVKYGTVSGQHSTILDPTTSTQQIVPGLTNGQTYYFVVSAINQAGEGVNSGQVSATPQAVLETITLNGTKGQAFSNASQANVSNVISSGSNRVLIVSIGLAEASATPSVVSLNYGSQALTKIDSIDRVDGSANFRQEFWYLLNPPTGSATLTAVFNRSVDEVHVGIVTLNGVRQQLPEAVAKNSGKSTSASVNLTSLTPGAWVIDSGITNFPFDTSATAASGQTVLWKTDLGSQLQIGSRKSLTTPTSTSMSWSFNTVSKNWTLIGLVFAPAEQMVSLRNHVAPAQAGAQPDSGWIPAFAGMTQGVIHFLSELIMPSAHADTLTPINFTNPQLTVNDPTTQIAVTSDCLSFNNIETYGNNRSYAYRSSPVTGNFTFEFDTILTASNSSTPDIVIWGLTSTAANTYDNWATAKAYVSWTVTSGNPKLRLTVNASSPTAPTLSYGIRYYARVVKSGNSLTLTVFSDPERQTTPLQTSTGTLTITSFPHLYIFSTNENILSNRRATGDVCRMGYSEPQSSYALTITKQGTGSGTVTSNPSGINCGATCVVNFSAGSTVTLSQSTASGSTFAGWSGGVCSGTAPCMVTMSAARNVTATFNAVVVPDPPELLNVTEGNGFLDLTWTPVNNATSYEVSYRYQVSPTSTTTSSVGVGNVTSHHLQPLTNETQYHVYVKAVNGTTKSAASNEIAKTPFDTSTLPDVPQVSISNIQSDRFTANWNTVTNGVSYKVFYGTTPNGPYPNSVDAGANTSAVISGLNVATNYYGVVTAYNSANRTTSSLEFSLSTLATNPPAQPVLNTPQAQNGRAILSWSAAAGATHYEIRYGTAPGQYTLTPINTGTTTSGIVEGLANGTAYHFVIAAINSAGTTLSNEAAITPQASFDVYVRDVKYNAAGQPTRVEFGNGVVTEYHYDSLNFHLMRIQTVNADGVWLQDLRYSYDAVGNVLSVDDHLASNVSTYNYDSLGRLTQAAGQAIGIKSYTYDKNGNVLTKDGRAYSYNPTGGPAHGVDTIDSNSFYDYDANGNLVQSTEAGVVRAYVYDTENRLQSVSKNGVQEATFKYDDSGERTVKSTANGERHFVYPLFEREGIQETSYIYLNGARVAAIDGGQLRYIHSDHLGSATVVSNSAGSIVESRAYEPFGDFAAVAPNTSGNYYTGQYFDKETNLYYYGARYYNPRVGQFMTADTLVSNPALSQSFNRYSYVLNNPINFTDPTGHVAFDISQRIDVSLLITQSVETDGMYFNIPILLNFSSEITRRIDIPEMKSFGMEDFLKGVALSNVLTDRVSDYCQTNCQTITPREMSTFDQVSLGLGFMPAASILSFSAKTIESSGHVFWAGGRVAEDAATKWALQNGGRTLGMTANGSKLNSLTVGMDWTKARTLWMNASKEFAQEATGPVHVFQNNAGISLQSIWRTVEYPILKNNQNIRIIYHNVP